MEREIRLAVRRVSLAIQWLRDRISRLMERLRTLISQVIRGPSEGWMTVVLLLLCVLVAAWSVGSALDVPPGFYGVLVSGVMLALVLAKTRLSWSVLLLVGVFAGLLLVSYQLTHLAESTATIGRYAEVGTRLLAAWQALLGRDFITDTLPFAFSLLFASWLAGFISASFLFRVHNIWGTLLPSAIIIVSAYLTLLRGEQLWHLYLYLTLAFLLTAQLFNFERQHEWDAKGIRRYPHYSKLRLHGAFWLATTAVLVTALLPVQPARIDPIAAAWDRLASSTRVLEDEFSRVFAGGPSGEPYMADFFGPTQTFGGQRTLSEDLVLIIDAPLAVYLSARSYDVYTPQGWKTSNTQLILPEQTSEHTAETQILKAQEIRVTVKILSSVRPGQPVPLGSYPVDMSIDHRMEVLQPARYRISVVTGSEPYPSAQVQSLPADLRQAVQRLHELRTASDAPLSEMEIRSVLPDDIRVVSWEHIGEQITEVTVERHVPVPHDIVSVRAARSLASGDFYQAKMLVSTATRSDLLAAGTTYPGWVLDRYLQLPEDMPSRVADLALELTVDAETPYEMAVAVRDYLRTLDYALDIEAPPEDTDGVEYFLFELEKGYCQYFASAMAVLLRSSGVPSRMVVGYGPGEMVDRQWPRAISDLYLLDDGTAEYAYHEWQNQQPMHVVRNSHAWCEVFFPEYGWIPFEPTPGYAIVTREGFAQLPYDDSYTDSELIRERPDDLGAVPSRPDDTDLYPGGTPPVQGNTPRHTLPLVVVAGLAILGTALWLIRRRLLTRVTEPRLAYARTGYLAAFSGLGPHDTMTPYEYGRRLTTALPEVSGPLNRIVDAYVRSYYGGRAPSGEDRLHIAEAWPQVRSHLLRRALRRLLPGKLR